MHIYPPSLYLSNREDRKTNIEKRVINIDRFSDLLIHSLNLCVCMTLLEMVTNDKNPAGTHN